ncbi:probable 2-oxoglutarate-dependent dioxygenase AOP1 isoform X1 [Triticum urartu]|uniref:probable 2-oxoglutarate-dependent dioxygenase AOP1 isoform X1 n=1 Tax=Triticum urartu TaxID=4572 RepID=UPI00204445AB|nr:probable 2-oxoglutarate-dependent dioxygenase AOP1 isoform X1 [Triticum urartu]
MAASPSSTLVSPPRVDLDGEDTSTLVRGTPEWLRCAGLVRRALEANGCVAVGCRRRVPPELRERMLVAMAELFALPRETKRRTGAADGPYRAYMEKRDSAACHHEAFGVLNAAAGGGEEARAFVARAWPHGNDRFLETLTSTAGEMARLARVILAMVVDGYGLSHRSDEIVAATDTNFRMLRYHNDNTRTSSSDGQPAVGLAAHVDGSYLTVLFQNDVDGFEMRTGDGGEWARVHSPGPDSLLVVADQPLVVSCELVPQPALQLHLLVHSWSSWELTCCRLGVTGGCTRRCTGWPSAGGRTGCPAACSCFQEGTSSSTRRQSWSPWTPRAGSGRSSTVTTSGSSTPAARARTCSTASLGFDTLHFPLSKVSAPCTLTN